MTSEPVTVGLSASGHQALKALEEAGVFGQLVDAYRFAVALGIAHGGFDQRNTARRTIFNVGSLDPDRSLYEAVAAVREDTDEPVYRTMERFAEWGAGELDRLASGGEIEFGTLLLEFEQTLD